MRLDIVTIFPEYFEGPLTASLLGKARKSGKISINTHDLRDFASDFKGRVDDSPYGGGAGMIMMAPPIVECVEKIATPTAQVVLLSASGMPFNQAMASRFASSEQLILVCGRYEGVDVRVAEILRAAEVSIGDYVLAGGEAAAMVVVDAVSRLVPGVMGNEKSVTNESYTSGTLEHPHYTRPAEYRGHPVPEVLLSGDHGAVAQWRSEQAKARTWRYRPDLAEPNRPDLAEPNRPDLAEPNRPDLAEPKT